MAAQALVVGADQVGLADGRGGLELAAGCRAGVPAELAHARPDRSRADQGDLAPAVHHGADLLGQVVDSCRVERPVGTGQHAGPDLDDPGLGRQDDVVADQVAQHRTGMPLAGAATALGSGDRRIGDRCEISTS